MRGLGFETLLQDRWLSPIIVTFFNPADPKFEFNRFYDLMKARGFIIYPGKLTVADSFRRKCDAWSNPRTVSFRSMTWVLWRFPWMKGFIFGFQRLAWWP